MKVDADPLWFEPTEPPSKRAIVGSALKLFVSRGYEGTSIRDIAQAAGYTNPAMFKFFRTKEQLGLHLFERAYREIVIRLEPCLAITNDAKSLENTLSGWVDAFFTILKDRGEAFLFVHDYQTHFLPMADKRIQETNLFRLMSAWLEHERRRRKVSKELPADMQMIAIGGFFHQLAKAVHLGEIRLSSAMKSKRDALKVLLRILQ